MLSIRKHGLIFYIIVFTCLITCSSASFAETVCYETKNGSSLWSVIFYDGDPKEGASLAPDYETEEYSTFDFRGISQITVLCKYKDGSSLEFILPINLRICKAVGFESFEVSCE